MKCRIVVDSTRSEEEVVIYVKKNSEDAIKIKNFVENSEIELYGYYRDEITKLSTDEIYCFTIEGGKLYAVTRDIKYLLKLRLYQIESMLDENFIKINQSSVANIKKIDKFDVSIAGSLIVKFKNGYRDYVSRRQIKEVKERLGIK